MGPCRVSVAIYFKPGLFMNALLRPTIHSLWLCVLAPAPLT